MSASNGTNGHAATKLDASDFLAKRKGAGYRPYALGGRTSAFIDGRPMFNWSQAETMRRDPQIDFGMRILRSPLYRATWKVHAKETKVAAFVDATIRRFWLRALRKVAKSFHVFGVHPGEFTYAYEGGLIQFGQLDDFHPRDSVPLEFKDGPNRGKLAGLRVRNVTDTTDGLGAGGQTDIVAPHAWWFAGDCEYGGHFGWPRIARAHEPWLEKRGKNGAIDSRRMGFRKAVFIGPKLRFPLGATDYGPADGSAPNLIANQDVARELVEKWESGSTLALPNVPHASDKLAGKYAWEWEDAKPVGEMPQLLEYPEMLDKEILRGMGIPPEIVDAATVGSGYSGRAIPAQVFFAMIDEDLSMILTALDEQCIRNLVALNFGAARYDIVPDSLAGLVAKNPDDANAGLVQGNGEQQEKEQGQKQQPVQMSHCSPASPKLIERIRTLAEQDFADLGPIQLSWSGEKTIRGTIKAVGSGEHAGKVLYGQAAQKALSAKQEGGAQPAAPKGEKPSVEHTIAHVAKLRENFTIEGLGHLAHVLQNHTVAEMGQIKQALGIKASGSKVELAKKIAQRALGAFEPEKGKEAEKPAEKKATDEPLLSADEVMAKAKQKGKAAKPAAAQQSPHAAKLKDALERSRDADGMSDAEIAATLAELGKLTLPQIKAAATEAGVTKAGATKAKILQTIRGRLTAAKRARAETEV